MQNKKIKKGKVAPKRVKDIKDKKFRKAGKHPTPFTRSQ